MRYVTYRLVMSSITTIFATWPSAVALARDIGVSEVTVRQWRNRSGAIPPRYWERVQKAALTKGVSLPIELFAPPGVIATKAPSAQDCSGGAL